MVVAAYYLWSTRKANLKAELVVRVRAWSLRLPAIPGARVTSPSDRRELSQPAAENRKEPRGHRLLIKWLPLIPLLPAAANTFGWIFTETARQPWLAFGLTKVADGLSPGLTANEVLASLLGFALIYGVLAVVWLRLVRHLSRQPLAPAPAPATAEVDEPAPVY
jgi:hypothetical protein